MSSRKKKLLALLGVALAAGAVAMWQGGDDDEGQRYGFSGGQFFPGAGLTAVQHDGTLSGSGTTLNPLSVVGGGSVSGTGTANTTTKWSGASALTNGWALDDGTTWGVAGKFAITEASGNTTVSGTLGVTGTSTLAAVNESGDYNLNAGKVTMAAASGNTSIGGTLGVTGTCTLAAVNESGDYNLNGGKVTMAAASGNTAIGGTLGVTGTSTLAAVNESGDYNLNGGKVTMAAASGNTVVGGTLGVTGDSTLSGSFIVNGVQTITTTGTVADQALNAGVTTLICNNASALTIDGFSGGVDGRILIVEGVGAGSVTLANDNAGGTVGDKIYAEAGSANAVLSGGGHREAVLRYSSNQSHWMLLSETTNTITTSPTYTNGITSNSTITNAGDFLMSGNGKHIRSSGTSPALSSCGTSPSILGGDSGFCFTTGSSTTTCTATFNVAYTTNAPACSCRAEGSATVPTCTTTTSALTCSVVVASTKYCCICQGVN